MAQTKADEFTEVDPENNNGWENSKEVADEIQIVFDTLNDVFVGKYIGMEDITRNDGKVMSQARFLKYGDTHFTNCGIDLKRKLSKVPLNSEVRIEWIAEMDTGYETPMRVFSVKYR